ncbi:MAG TPA: hypothetical protein VGV92_01935 [Gammaproteobacteria bacterium]|nr:hypothetical protein [Gammaproteobacteria bacterium]
MILLILMYPYIAPKWAVLLFPLKFYPVLINIFMLVLFAQSLMFPPTIIERIARKTEKTFPPEAVLYTRRVTQVWCVFFIINGTISLITIFWASPKVWSLYNGVISYLLMGLLFGSEYLVRLSFKRRHHAKLS